MRKNLKLKKGESRENPNKEVGRERERERGREDKKPG